MGQNEFLLKIRPDEKVRKTDTNHISGWSGSQDDSSWLLWRNILAAGRLAECTRSCETHKARTRWRRKSHWAQRESTVSHFHAGIFSSYWFRGLKERKKREQLMMELNGQTRGDLTEVDAGRWRRCCLIEFSRRFFLHPPAPSTKILSQDVAKCIPADPVADRWPNPTKIPIRMQKSFSNFQIFKFFAARWRCIEIQLNVQWSAHIVNFCDLCVLQRRIERDKWSKPQTPRRPKSLSTSPAPVSRFVERHLWKIPGLHSIVA